MQNLGKPDFGPAPASLDIYKDKTSRYLDLKICTKEDIMFFSYV